MKNSFSKKAFLTSVFIFATPILLSLVMTEALTNQEIAKVSSEVAVLAAKFGNYPV